MELTAESLQQVKFGAKVRGYDPEEVDRFIANVTEIGEELHERLRRATERAQKAEEQLANAPAAPAEMSPANQSAELGRIWERAVAAAEGAVEEARAEAKTILDEAHRSAEETLGNATRQADETLGGAQREAQRLAEESQGQIRADIARLEAARDQLKSDVDGLSAFLTDEKSRLRDAIVRALSNIDDYGSVGDSAPSLSHVEVPQPSQPQFSTPAPAPQAQSYDEAPTYTPPSSVDEPAQPSWAQEQPIEAPAPQQVQWQEPEPVQSQEEDDSDPFLAELRRAVRDDGPLGPRDDETEEDSIDRLYSDGDDDKSFFKRK